MEKKFRSPVEKIGLGGIQFCSALVLAYSFEWIAKMFLQAGELMMDFRIVRFVFQSFAKSFRGVAVGGRILFPWNCLAMPFLWRVYFVCARWHRSRGLRDWLCL